MDSGSHRYRDLLPVTSGLPPQSRVPNAASNERLQAGVYPPLHPRLAPGQQLPPQPDPKARRYQQHGAERRRLTRVACGACRRRKAKCDGRRPVCGRCTAEGLDCLFDCEPGISRAVSLRRRNVALQERLEQLENLVDTLTANIPRKGRAEIGASRIVQTDDAADDEAGPNRGGRSPVATDSDSAASSNESPPNSPSNTSYGPSANLTASSRKIENVSSEESPPLFVVSSPSRSASMRTPAAFRATL